MGRFDLHNRIMGSVDRIFAERFRVSPMDAGRVSAVDEKVEVVGALRTGSEKQARPFSKGTAISSASAELHIDRARYEALAVRTGYRVRALDRPGQPLFEVKSIDDRVAGRLIVHLVQT